MRIRLRGLNSITKRLADGTRRTYWYAWKGGPPLRGEPGTPEFIASYNEAVARKVTPPTGKLLFLLQAYQASEDFRGLADSTRRSYVPLIKRIEKTFADLPLSGLTDRRTRGIFLAWRDGLAVNTGRRQADYAWSVLARVLSWSLDRGHVAANPCTHGGRLYRGSRRDPLRTKPRFWSAHRRICICRSCSRCGLARDKATYCAFPGRPTTADTFACARVRPARAL